jgi:hypothetical protein
MRQESAAITMTRWLVVCLCLTVAGTGAAGKTEQGLSALTVQQWREDLTALARGLTSKHQDPFHTVAQATLNAAISDLETRLPSLSGPQVAVEFARIVAMIGDGHTELQLLQPAVGFTSLPVAFYRYAEGMFLTAATEELKEFLGARVLRVGDVDVDEAIARVTPLLAGDTAIEFLHSAPSYLASPEILSTLGVTSDRAAASFEVLTRSGERRRMTARSASNPARLITMRQAAGITDPLSASRNGSYYWFTSVADMSAAYFQLNASMNQDGVPSLADVTRDFFRKVDAERPAALILDVRNNNGGNIDRNRAWITAIENRPAYKGKGKLFVIVGRRTYSAGVDIVLQLQRVAQPSLVGESPRGIPASPGNRETFTLPHSRLIVDYSQKIDGRAFRAKTPPLQVDMAAPPRFDAAIAGRDPALDAIRTALTAPSAIMTQATPASTIAGQWTVTAAAAQGDSPNGGNWSRSAVTGTLTITEKDNKVSGTWNATNGEEWPLTGHIDGTGFSFSTVARDLAVVIDGKEAKMRYRWTFRGDLGRTTLRGTMSLDRSDEESAHPQPFEANRAK